MHTPRPHRGPPHWLRPPRRTARLRLTVLYAGAVFVACGATVVAFTYLLYSLLNRPRCSSQCSTRTFPPNEAKSP